MSFDRAFNGDTYTIRVSSGSGPSRPSLTSWALAARKAAKVLPDPVGAATKTCCPACSAGHARSCAGVGASKVRENQAATAGWNESRVFMAWHQQVMIGCDYIQPTYESHA